MSAIIKIQSNTTVPGWIVRDKTGKLYLLDTDPELWRHHSSWDGDYTRYCPIGELDNDSYPEYSSLTWKDEPISVTDITKVEFRGK